MVKISTGKQRVHEAEPKKPSRADRNPRPGADGTPILLRLQPPLLKIVDTRAQQWGCSRPEAVRRMINISSDNFLIPVTKRERLALDAERAGW